MTANTLTTPAALVSLGRDAARRAVFTRLFDEAAQRAYADRHSEFVIEGDALPWWVDDEFCAAAVPSGWTATYRMPVKHRTAHGVIELPRRLHIEPADARDGWFAATPSYDGPAESCAHN